MGVIGSSRAEVVRLQKFTFTSCVKIKLEVVANNPNNQ